MKTMLADSDLQLVERSRDGDSEAFGRIVEQYQGLICGLIYSACGDLHGSEDLAQVTFLTAWRELPNLREPAKFKSWLCGIARNVSRNSYRREQHAPITNAGTLDAAPEISSDVPTPRDQAISREEEAILWRALSEMPETYREPLVLFYRQQQHVAEVADALGVSEDVVRQRLSRGRTMLSEQVARFVESALQTSGPTKAFTLGVVAALPVFATTAKAGTVGAIVAKGSVAAKAAGVVGLFGTILGPVIGILGGWLGTKASLDNAGSERERRFIIRMSRQVLILVGALFVSQALLFFAMNRYWHSHAVVITGAIVGTWLIYLGLLLAMIITGNRTQRRIREEDGTLVTARVRSDPIEYRSAGTLLGLPLIHVDLGQGRVAKGWLAIGDKAVGFIACGGLAAGVVSVGGFSIGVLSIGGLAAGVLSIAGAAVGVWAIGGIAIGYVAIGGCAIAWLAANGGLAVAHEIAVGGAAIAHHANDEVARAFVNENRFLAHGVQMMKHSRLLVLLPVGFVFWQILRSRKRSHQH